MNKYSKGIAHILLLIAVIVVGIGGLGYYMYQNGQLNRNVQETDENSEITPANIAVESTSGPDSTSSWKTYSIEQLNFRYKLPQAIHDREAEHVTVEKPGETGSFICSTFSYNNSINKTHMDCPIKIFGIASFSNDFTAGRGKSFRDARGFDPKNNQWEENLPKDLVTYSTNPNNIEMLIIEGHQFEPVHSTLHLVEGKVGAVINTPFEKYPGLTVIMNLDEKNNIDKQLFVEILSTFEFVD